MAEIVSCSLWLPIDIIKERLQVQSEVKIYNYRGPLEAIKKINLTEGIIGLYRVCFQLFRLLEPPSCFLAHLVQYFLPPMKR